MKVTVVGTGYVGTSNAVLLAQHNEVVLLDVVQEKVNMINNRISPIEDELITEYLQTDINLKATIYKEDAYANTDFIIIAVPTDYSPETKYFNTSLIEMVIEDIKKYAPADALTVIKSTIPVGYVLETREKMNYQNLIFSPEFLREGTALRDNMYPDRIIVGEKSARAEMFANLLINGCKKEDPVVLYMNPTEAEAVKLFANTYLAMRVSYFNELDTYAENNNLNSADIIAGMCNDHRIGTHYNNPSFGYGGYCFIKDVQQLQANVQDSNCELIGSIHNSNINRKETISKNILSKSPKTVGIFRLTMKANSDNFRNSAIFDIIKSIQEENINIIIYEKTFKDTNFNGIPVINNIDEFRSMSDVIVANRIEPEIESCKDKVYSRDIFRTDS